MKAIKGSPPALPGSCYLCSSASREVYIDLETQMEFHGAVYLCDKCVTQMGDALGMLSVAKSEALKDDLAQAVRENLELQEEVLAVKDVLRGYNDVRDYLDRDSLPSGDNDSSEPSLSEREKELAGGEGGSSESSDVKGLGDLFSAESSK